MVIHNFTKNWAAVSPPNWTIFWDAISKYTHNYCFFLNSSFSCAYTCYARKQSISEYVDPRCKVHCELGSTIDFFKNRIPELCISLHRKQLHLLDCKLHTCPHFVGSRINSLEKDQDRYSDGEQCQLRDHIAFSHRFEHCVSNIIKIITTKKPDSQDEE